MKDLPIGLTMTLAEHEDALRRFALMTEAERAQVVAQASQVTSRNEMQALVRRLADPTGPF